VDSGKQKPKSAAAPQQPPKDKQVYMPKPSTLPREILREPTTPQLPLEESKKEESKKEESKKEESKKQKAKKSSTPKPLTPRCASTDLLQQYTQQEQVGILEQI
jgi:hypothetical protein